MMMPNQALVMVEFFLLCVLHMGLICSSAGNRNGIGCLENERQILLELKEGFQNQSGRFESWIGTDCCTWQGVRCNKLTGHVIHLDLSSSIDKYSISMSSEEAPLKPSLIGLKHLQFLDLSGNNFTYSPFPHFLDSFQELSYLDLHDCNFFGSVPEQYGNISTMRYLDLSRNAIHESGGYWLHILSRLHLIHSLKLNYCGLTFLPQTLPNSSFAFLSVLDLSGNDFYSTVPAWLYRITSLQQINLSDCSLQGTISHDVGALSSLKFLNFAMNNLQGLIPGEIGTLSMLLTLNLSQNSLVIASDPKGPGSWCNLKDLDLSMQTQPGIDLKEFGGFWSHCMENSLEVLDISSSALLGNLPDWLWELKNINTLNLQQNSISGSVPAGIGKLSSLKSLDISNNQLNGSIDKAIRNLSKLETLVLDGNHLKGVLTESHFSQLVCLKHLHLSGNSLAVDIGSEWLSTFQLEAIDMSGCPLGPLFPPWLQGQKKLRRLCMSSSLIGSLPDWFWSFALNLEQVDLSHNNIHGMIPSLLSVVNNNLTRDNSCSNSFHGVKKLATSQITYLDLSNNSFSGPLPVDFAEAMPNLITLYLAMNSFTGHVPYSLCDLAVLQKLDLSENSLSGDIPSCWKKTSNLRVINFRDNYLSGEFPCSFCFSNSVLFIQLNDNNLSGNLPHCLKKCTNILLLDVGNNRLTGSLPRWLGESFPYLMALSLRSNLLIGSIPPQLSFLNKLQILDLSGNNLSDEIPPSLGNLTGMKFYQKDNMQKSRTLMLQTQYYISIDSDLRGSYLYYVYLDAGYLAVIDLSSNKLSGEIPNELTDLTALITLNLSNNRLGGEITSKIGKLRNLEFLDLSRNQLDGLIPYSLSNLSFLSRLNLSYNLLSGRIPTGPQLQTLTDPSIYEGNLNLCGPPLNNYCKSPNVELPSHDDNSNQSDGDSMWNLGSMGLGFAVGLLGFCGFILHQSKWSDRYLQFLDKLLYNFFFNWLI
jgi:Leucine-rich repeat (LRR) protein